MADPRDFGKLDPNCGAGCTGPMTTDVKPVSAPEDNWKHRSRTMKCLTCMYFVEKESTCLAPTPDYLVGRCRRHAPTMSGWPVMRGGDWCGDHKLDENKV